MTEQELLSALEAIIYAADEPATLDQIVAAITGEKPHLRKEASPETQTPPLGQTPAEISDTPQLEGGTSLETRGDASSNLQTEAHEGTRAQIRAEIRSALDKLVASYAADERGIEIRKVAGGWKMYTKAQHHELVRRFIKALRPPLRLTMPALETLSVIAYKQPATLPEINEIRGVNCGGVVKTLLERRLITTAGRKDAVGRPILYRTSKDFLMRFGLADLDELPSLKEFEQLAQAALGADDGIAPIEPAESPADLPSEIAQLAGAASTEPDDMSARLEGGDSGNAGSTTESSPQRASQCDSETTDSDSAPETKAASSRG